MKHLFLLGCIVSIGQFCMVSCNQLKQPKEVVGIRHPEPEEGEENERNRELYNELRHKAAPGTDWKVVEENNARNNEIIQSTVGRLSSFANGHLNGFWDERGSNNQTGNVRCSDYVPSTNKIYTIGNGGSIWSSTLESGNWTLLNQKARPTTYDIKVFEKQAGGTRILIGDRSGLLYSDNDGATFAPSYTFPVSWGGNYAKEFYKQAGSTTVYCLAHAWSSSPWAARYKLLMSTNEGQSFTEIYQFNQGNDTYYSGCMPYNTGGLYFAEVDNTTNSIRIYSVTGSTVSAFSSFSRSSASNFVTLRGTNSAGSLHLYAMVDNNVIYHSNGGASWTLQSNLPIEAWNEMDVSINDWQKVFIGGVDAYRSTNAGVNFTLVNSWSDYYGSPSTKLHADMMEMKYFKKSDNTEFCIINCHGGTYISYNNLQTVSNLSLLTHRVSEHYDVLTDTLNPSRIFAGTQDQGLQRTLAGTTPGPQNFIQILSGDYGQMALTNNNSFLWPQYVGGVYYCYSSLGGASPTYAGSFEVLGNQKPNYGWMLATTSTNDISSNAVLIGGGNMTGGGGSYLIRAMNNGSGNFSHSQYAFDFRANSNSGTAGITAIEVTPADANRMYVATEDGTFFYSTNAGSSWTKTASFSGPTPWYLYGSSILASRINANTVWFAGSGYSNPGVYKSTNGGASFTSMSAGLPSTLVYELVALPDESLLFAATDAGPYVYVAVDNQWYPMTDATIPNQAYTTVEYIRSQNIVRFATFGRGIWDFVISGTVPTTLSSWDVLKQGNTVKCSWKTETETNTSHFTIQRNNGGTAWTNLGNVPAHGPGDYSFTDAAPLKGNNFYRLLSVDKNGSNKASEVRLVSFENVSFVSIFPNPVRTTLNVQWLQAAKNDVSISVYDAAGKQVLQQIKDVRENELVKINVATLPPGNYYVSIRGKALQQSIPFSKQ